MTTVNIDSPTQSQFQLPRRNMRGEDGAKNLVRSEKWCNKVTGCVSYGFGMLAFCAHESLGGGANLMLTCLHLTLLAHHMSGRVLGEVLHCQMDNTTGEMKTQATFAYLAYLVSRGTFLRARAHFNDKGHTHTGLDQTFRTLIRKLFGVAVYTILDLLRFLHSFLAVSNCRDSQELHCLFDFSNWLLPQTRSFGGFATCKLHEGMHEVEFYKDSDGVVRALFRRHCLSSTYFPEGKGYPVFEHALEGAPALAKLKTDSEWKSTKVMRPLNDAPTLHQHHALGMRVISAC